MAYVNYQLRYKTKGRFVFVPTDECREYGNRLLDECRAQIELPNYHYHYTPGGHVAALHQHIASRFFFRIDIQSFFYAIRRNRVAAALRHFGIKNSRERAKWSCVANPYTGEGYALPIGFVQSPILASLVIMRSPIAAAIERAQDKGAFVSMYFDDFIGSSADEQTLIDVYCDLLIACAEASLPINADKLIEPSPTAEAFNCLLSNGLAEVKPERIEKFFSVPRSPESTSGFAAYCERVASKNG